MNVIQRPAAQEFSATMKDYIIDTDSTIRFGVKYGSKLILDEEYSPDKNFQVRIRQLGKFCENALWGSWCTGDTAWQSTVAGNFTFLINEVEDSSCYVIFSRLATRKKADAPGWLSEVREKVTRKNTLEYVSSIFERGEKAVVAVRTEDNMSMVEELYTHLNAEKSVITLDVSYQRVIKLFPLIETSIVSYSIIKGGDSFKFFVDQSTNVESLTFRYKNVYDLPETLMPIGDVYSKPSRETDNATVYGIERVMKVKATDEYTVNSGVFYLPTDYKLWHNLMNSQEVQVWCDGEWYSVIVIKSNYDRDLRRVVKNVEFTFRMANPDHNNLLEI